jgi:hypothetical protein
VAIDEGGEAAPPPAPSPDDLTESRPPAVPRPSAMPDPPPPEAPVGPAFFTYNALPPATPPLDTSELVESHLPPPHAAPEPEVQASPHPPPPPPRAETPAPAPPEPPEPRKPPQPPKPPREPWSTGLIVAVVITAVLLLGGGAAALLLSGRDEPKSAAATSTRSDADLRRQVLTLDALMKRSRQGRAAAAKGDTKAAVANRSELLKDLRRLRGDVKDAKLKAGLGIFVSAIRESLRQNRECAGACPASDLAKVSRLKRDTVEALNPLLRKYAKSSYRSRDI